MKLKFKKRNYAENGLCGNTWALTIEIIHFIIKNMKYFLGYVGVRGSMRGLFFTRQRQPEHNNRSKAITSLASDHEKARETKILCCQHINLH